MTEQPTAENIPPPAFFAELKANCERAQRYAEQPAHWYTGLANGPPSDEQCFKMAGMEVVFTWTVTQPNGVARHMSIAMVDPTTVPEQSIICTVAHLLGFTGGEPDEYGVVRRGSPSWHGSWHPIKRHVFVVVEALPDELSAVGQA